ncbi:hypothetical protein [Gilvimarinus algae]|uniref:Uncharacterized protein n=1 Tax=Gilvimarinus algae TaxID=3058037 RepID=A0ABT8TKG9_9GAMM|nr:hypothetical protein [Gilvimarinus sp. SDUM040014]MDO3383141.1 hypothetical protein [Gilvimarinus sp. SDUM040014]
MNKKLLTKNFLALEKVFFHFYLLSISDTNKSAFLSASTQCKSILNLIDEDDYEKATQEWYTLMHFSDDSVPISEEYLEKYTPLKQRIINSGLQ